MPLPVAAAAAPILALPVLTAVTVIVASIFFGVPLISFVAFLFLHPFISLAIVFGIVAVIGFIKG